MGAEVFQLLGGVADVGLEVVFELLDVDGTVLSRAKEATSEVRRKERARS